MIAVAILYLNNPAEADAEIGIVYPFAIRFRKIIPAIRAKRGVAEFLGRNAAV